MLQFEKIPSLPRSARVTEPNCGSCTYFQLYRGGFCALAYPTIVRTDINKTCDGHTGNFVFAINFPESIIIHIRAAINEYRRIRPEAVGLALTVKISPFYIDEIKEEINKMSTSLNPHSQHITIFGNYLLFDENVPENKIIIAHRLITIK
ncbi:MAG: hypothetical protein RBT57_02895 [Paludibacter sp.]|jgi:hypothetical protein|nr:hypothetical protein [Paludibacter sp.]